MGINEFVFRILICFGLSFIIGIERQYRNRPVGLRTSILVSIGSFLFVSFSFLVGSTDLSRIASQVVTGIGFLGAGVILKDGAKVRGLTTAATLWCVAAIGVLCAGGALKEASFGTLIILFSNTLLRYINGLVQSYSNSKKTHCTYEIKIGIKENDYSKIKNNLLKFISDNNAIFELSSFDVKENLDTFEIKLVINILKSKNNILNEYFNELSKKYNLQSYKLIKVNEIIDDDEEL